MTTLDNLPLRGFLNCPHCGKQLTGSASKGRHSYCYYYHCTSACGVRFKAELANELFQAELDKYIPMEGLLQFYVRIIKDIFTEQTGSQTDGKRELSLIQAENDRLAKARRLLLDDAIDSNDYKLIKTECEYKLQTLEAKLTGFGKTSFDFSSCLDKALNALSRIKISFNEGDLALKRAIIGSLYPKSYALTGWLIEPLK